MPDEEELDEQGASAAFANRIMEIMDEDKPPPRVAFMALSAVLRRCVSAISHVEQADAREWIAYMLFDGDSGDE